jgi:hypothetical protein
MYKSEISNGAMSSSGTNAKYLGEDQNYCRAFEYLKLQSQFIANGAIQIPPDVWDEGLLGYAMAKNIVEDIIEDEHTQADLIATKELLAAPYWRRSWICQEVIVSRDALILYGQRSISLSDFERSFQFVRNLMPCAISFINENGLEHPRTELLGSVFNRYEDSNVRFLLDARKAWRTDSAWDLNMLLSKSASFEATVRHDKIFAFIGLADPHYAVTVDYSATLEDAYRHTCKRIILHDMLLDVLCVCNGDNRNPGLPSWTPDWEDHDRSFSLIEDQEKYRDNHPILFKASGQLQATPTFLPHAEIQDRILRVQCLFIDQLATEDTLLSSPSENTWPGMVDSWAHLVGIDLEESEDTYFTGEHISLAYLRVLWRGMSSVDFPNDSDDPSEHEEYLRDLGNKRLLAVRTIQEWKFFRSPKGYLGVTEAEATYTDRLCVLLGASVPFVLRQEGNHYKLVGEAYVHGFMYGEAIGMMRKGELHVDTIDII